MTQVPSTSLPWEMEIGEKHCFHSGNRVSIFSGIPDRDYPQEIMYQTIAEIWPGDDNCDIKDGEFIMMVCHCHKELIMALVTAEEFVEGTIKRGATPHPEATLREIRAAIAKVKNFKVETGA